jgi:hypothetical protein
VYCLKIAGKTPSSSGETPLLQLERVQNEVTGYFTQSLPAFQRKVYHPKGAVEADINLVVFFGS